MIRVLGAFVNKVTFHASEKLALNFYVVQQKRLKELAAQFAKVNVKVVKLFL